MSVFRRIMLGGGIDIDTLPDTQKLYYQATAKVTPKSNSLGASLIVNKWDATTGEGVIVCSSDITTIDSEAFRSNTKITSITIPNSVTTIGDYAFGSCKSLTSVTIPNSVTTIGVGAFKDCTSLTSVTIGNGITSIDSYAFKDCTSLTSVYINDIASWCNITFSDYTASPLIYARNLYLNNELVTDLVIPDSVTTIGKYAFCKYNSLTSVTIGDNVTSIRNMAFGGCTNLTQFNGKYVSDDGKCLIIDGILNSFAPAGLTEYVIPDSVTTIGNGAFIWCDTLTSITIPNSVTTIGNQAFFKCNNLTSVYCKAITPPTLGGTFVFDENHSGRKIYVPMESVEVYKSATRWSWYADAIEGYEY